MESSSLSFEPLIFSISFLFASFSALLKMSGATALIDNSNSSPAELNLKFLSIVSLTLPYKLSYLILRTFPFDFYYSLS